MTNIFWTPSLLKFLTIVFRFGQQQLAVCKYPLKRKKYLLIVGVDNFEDVNWHGTTNLVKGQGLAQRCPGMPTTITFPWVGKNLLFWQPICISVCFTRHRPKANRLHCRYLPHSNKIWWAYSIWLFPVTSFYNLQWAFVSNQ